MNKKKKVGATRIPQSQTLFMGVLQKAQESTIRHVFSTGGREAGRLAMRHVVSRPQRRDIKEREREIESVEDKSEREREGGGGGREREIVNHHKAIIRNKVREKEKEKTVIFLGRFHEDISHNVGRSEAPLVLSSLKEWGAPVPTITRG